MQKDIKQPVAWQLHGELREIMSLRPNMQPAEWMYRFKKFWPFDIKELTNSDVRNEMFDTLSKNGLAERHYANQLDALINNNEGWRPKISDWCLVCCAFPLCDIGVCHHRSIPHRRGYEDKNGRTVTAHRVSAYFGHRRTLPKHLNDIHKADLDRRKHDISIDELLRHLEMHPSGFYVMDRCPKCKDPYEALRVSGPTTYKAKYRENDETGGLKYEYDIGVINDSDNLFAIIEAYNTHKMGQEKRNYASSAGYQWLEYSVNEMLMGHHSKGIHSRPRGWFELDAIKLKIGHSGADCCPKCLNELVQAQILSNKRAELRNRIAASNEKGQQIEEGVLDPIIHELNRIERTICFIDPGFSIEGYKRVSLELVNLEVVIGELQDRLNEVLPYLLELKTIKEELDINQASQVNETYCTKTGLILSSKLEAAIPNMVPAKYKYICDKCCSLLEIISDNQWHIESCLKDFDLIREHT